MTKRPQNSQPLFYRKNPGSIAQIANETIYPGNIFFVDSVTGINATGGGYSPAAPFASITYALTKCIASMGDVIFTAPGHTESITTAGAITAVAGVKVIGLGWGNNRPLFTWNTSTAATMAMSASMRFENCVFKNGLDGMVAPIIISAADVQFINCETIDNNASYAATNFITTTAAADRFQLLDWTHTGIGGKTGAVSALTIVGGTDIVIKPKSVVLDASTAVINNITTASVNLQIYGTANDHAYIKTLNSADVIFAGHANTTGRVGPFINARLKDNAANITAAFVGAKMEFFQPINLVNADGESSLQTTITASTNA